jgi:hypothetical protein
MIRHAVQDVAAFYGRRIGDELADSAVDNVDLKATTSMVAYAQDLLSRVKALPMDQPCSFFGEALPGPSRDRPRRISNCRRRRSSNMKRRYTKLCSPTPINLESGHHLRPARPHRRRRAFRSSAGRRRRPKFVRSPAAFQYSRWLGPTDCSRVRLGGRR